MYILEGSPQDKISEGHLEAKVMDDVHNSGNCKRNRIESEFTHGLSARKIVWSVKKIVAYVTTIPVNCKYVT